MDNLKTRTTTSNPTHTFPSFFKILLDDSNPNLPLPPAFVNKQFLNSKFPENPVLETEFGGKWKVGIEKIGGKLCFVNGWLQFVEDTKTEIGDFLVFWLIGKSTFKVSIFGPNACAKDLRFATPTHCSCNCSRSGNSDTNLMNEIKIEQDDDDDDDDDASKIEEEDDDDDDEIKIEEDDGVDEEEVKDEVKNDYDFKEEDIDEDDTDSNDDEDEYDDEDELKEVKVQHFDCDRNDDEDELKEINAQEFDWKEECLIPSFEKVLTKANNLALRLPSRFVKETRLDKKEKIMIRNKEKKKWIIRIGRRVCGDHHLAHGWVRFWKENKLMEGDICSFKYFHGENCFIEFEVVKRAARKRGRPRLEA